MSPVVSYQYFDWPGDENVIFTNSANVSYRYDGPPGILAQPASQVIRAGTTVVLSVSADGTSPLSYQWRLNGVALDTTNSPSIQIPNAQPANSGSYSVVVTNAYAPAAVSNDALLTVYMPATGPSPTPPSIQPGSQPPPPGITQPPPVPGAASLQVFGANGQPDPAATPDPGKMTIVMTHGWMSSSDAWPRQMAAALIYRRYNTLANIVAWDWRVTANPNNAGPNASGAQLAASLSEATSYTRMEGVALGRTLSTKLGAGYNRPIHFLGHSLGTLVNCVAADYVHGDLPGSAILYNPYVTHVTLFDEAEIAQAVHGTYVNLDALLRGTVPSQNASWSWKVLPTRSRWRDNYVSLVGFLHPTAVNAMLWRQVWLNPAQAHGYGYDWYIQTIIDPALSTLGHKWSFERSSLAGAEPELGSYFDQSKAPAASDMLLTRLNSAHEDQLRSYKAWAYPHLAAYDGLYGFNATVDAAISGVLQFGHNAAVAVTELFRPNTAPRVFVGSANSTPAYFGIPTVPQTLQGTWSFQFNVGGQAPRRLANGARAVGHQDDGGGSAAYIVIPVAVPADARGLSFDYMFEGAADGDFMAMAIGDQRYFTLEAQYTDGGQWTTSPVIDVAAFAGQQIQLTFVVNNANNMPAGMLQVQAVQFFSPPKPQLKLAIAGNQMTASWPILADSWSLEANDNIANSNSWQAVTLPPTEDGFTHAVTVDITGEQRFFFRLTK